MATEITTAEPPPTPIADLPSGDPIPSSTPPVPAPKPAPFPLRALLASAPSNVDAFLTHLSKCLSTPSGIDGLFLFVGYSSRLSSSLLSALSRSALRRSARDWVALVSSLPPKSTLVFGVDSALPSTAAASAALVLANRLRALSALCSETRTIFRLWSFLGIYFWARTLILRTLHTLRTRRAASSSSSSASSLSPGEKLSKTDTTTAAVDKGVEEPAPIGGAEAAISYAQLALCIVFQSLESRAYLSSRGILGWSPAAQGRASRLSARLWGCYVGIELGRLLAEAAGKVPAKFPDADLRRRQIVRNTAWLPLTAHWGSEGGVVSDWAVGAIGLIPGVLSIRQLWKDTA